MKRCRTCKQTIKPKPREEIITVDGINYKRYHYDGGMTVESPCKCYGALYRAHSVSLDRCPWMRKRAA
jgi:hypothetical protein